MRLPSFFFELFLPLVALRITKEVVYLVQIYSFSGPRKKFMSVVPQVYSTIIQTSHEESRLSVS